MEQQQIPSIVVKAKRVAKPPGFWTAKSTTDVLEQVIEGLSMNAAAATLGVPFHRLNEHVNWWRHKQMIYSPTWKGFGDHKGDSSSEKLIGKVDWDKVSIDWAEFFGMEKPEALDLQVICSMFYASEQIITKAQTAFKVTSEMGTIIRRAHDYVNTWAERFAKYTLAACLGEFRHRRQAGALKLVPKTRGKSRAAAQYAATRLWGDAEKMMKAGNWLVEKFADRTYFSSSSYGGHKWSRIAKAFVLWHSKQMPNVVFADYVWDLSHNGGRFFDKCHLFNNEHLVRVLLSQKASDKTGDVRTWGTKWIHDDWLRGLELMDIANLPAPREA